ncbi:hypothetical protein FQN57_004641 [Myotisia sp. PD_48]|nr:hypothetical protein FQN57_004641 [Myotisia sp. PD_48]
MPSRQSAKDAQLYRPEQPPEQPEAGQTQQSDGPLMLGPISKIGKSLQNVTAKLKYTSITVWNRILETLPESPPIERPPPTVDEGIADSRAVPMPPRPVSPATVRELVATQGADARMQKFLASDDQRQAEEAQRIEQVNYDVGQTQGPPPLLPPDEDKYDPLPCDPVLVRIPQLIHPRPFPTVSIPEHKSLRRLEGIPHPILGNFVEEALEQAYSFITTRFPTNTLDRDWPPWKNRVKMTSCEINPERDPDWIGMELDDRYNTEKWFGRRSIHEDEVRAGTASFAEFKTYFQPSGIRHRAAYNSAIDRACEVATYPGVDRFRFKRGWRSCSARVHQLLCNFPGFGAHHQLLSFIEITAYRYQRASEFSMTPPGQQLEEEPPEEDEYYNGGGYPQSRTVDEPGTSSQAVYNVQEGTSLFESNGRSISAGSSERFRKSQASSTSNQTAKNEQILPKSSPSNRTASDEKEKIDSEVDNQHSNNQVEKMAEAEVPVNPDHQPDILQNSQHEITLTSLPTEFPRADWSANESGASSQPSSEFSKLLGRLMDKLRGLAQQSLEQRNKLPENVNRLINEVRGLSELSLNQRGKLRTYGESEKDFRLTDDELTLLLQLPLEEREKLFDEIKEFSEQFLNQERKLLDDKDFVGTTASPQTPSSPQPTDHPQTIGPPEASNPQQISNLPSYQETTESQTQINEQDVNLDSILVVQIPLAEKSVRYAIKAFPKGLSDVAGHRVSIEYVRQLPRNPERDESLPRQIEWLSASSYIQEGPMKDFSGNKYTGIPADMNREPGRFMSVVEERRRAKTCPVPSAAYFPSNFLSGRNAVTRATHLFAQLLSTVIKRKPKEGNQESQSPNPPT